MKTVAKFALVERHELSMNPAMRRLVFEPRYDSSIPEDARFLRATPSGRIEMLTDNAYLIAADMGQQFTVEFAPNESGKPQAD